MNRLTSDFPLAITQARSPPRNFSSCRPLPPLFNSTYPSARLPVIGDPLLGPLESKGRRPANRRTIRFMVILSTCSYSPNCNLHTIGTGSLVAKFVGITLRVQGETLHVNIILNGGGSLIIPSHAIPVRIVKIQRQVGPTVADTDHLAELAGGKHLGFNDPPIGFKDHLARLHRLQW